MFAMLLFACIVGHPDDCRIIPIAVGFTSQEACGASALLALGWLKIHPEFELKSGTRPICTTDANYLVNRFKA